MAENSAMDWILINLKFKGKCVECGKGITSGRALWSRSAKSIKHLDCSVGNQPSSNEKTGSPSQETFTHKKYRKTLVQRCLICGKEEPIEDEYDFNEYPYLAESRSQSYICQSCLDSEDSFEAYRQAFLQKIKRYMKPAISI
jgi:hypothetical protein